MYMNNQVINLKIDSKTKREAQKVAEKLGFSLSSILKAYLKQLISEKSIVFSIPEKERELSDEAIRHIDEAFNNVKRGYVSPPFSTADEAIAWLNDKDARYENGEPV